jgi:glycosyltransferase involved in cell wall biosynthesis
MLTPQVAAITVDSLMPRRRSLRVAVVTETWPPEVNGVAATISRVVAELRENGHEVQLVRPRQHPHDASVQEDGYAEVLMRGLPIPRYPQLKMGLPSKRALQQLWGLSRPDVVHIVTEGPLGWSALQAALQLKLPVVSDFRTNFHAYSRHYGAAWLHKPIMAYLRKFHNRTACTMVPTEGLRAELGAAGFQQLRVVARGVDTLQFDPSRRSLALRQSWGVAPQQMVAMCVGRLAAEKNMPTLLAAFEQMRRAEPGTRLVLVGDGPEREALQRQCPQAVFAGLRRGDDLATHYASADVFLFPSLTETYGNVLPEAMASGLAVVGFDYAAAGNLVRHGENGLLVRYGDNTDFCAVAARLAGQHGYARALGAQARMTALQLDWGSIAREVEAEYLNAMIKSAGPRDSAWTAQTPVKTPLLRP